MAERFSPRYTFVFAAIVCVACSLVVSSAAKLLAERQDRNVRIDIQKNILRAVGLVPEGSALASAEVESLYEAEIRGLVVDKQGRIVPGKTPSDLDPAEYTDPRRDPKEVPVFVRLRDGRPAAYAFPIAGKGLWSTLYGYFALEPDGNTVKGITFYKHGETPGLGAEIEQPWFQDNFVGKKVLDGSGNLVSVTVVKGQAPDEAPHQVDGISGATMTSRGVNELLMAGLKRYEPFFARVRKGEEVH